ncbi:hypothetical protein N7478_003744 [Penicillium angulare]|uniref:uncharacterized protein n=1 Tax=Penicillium angulare TaxID=116970 RepID=UPI002541D759|nr:uncharacterized protein N7478_003744 [Penicillium angulare]KAJ5288058.1 hypothetical protein N7478_003744 [Penicillium angulare]
MAQRRLNTSDSTQAPLSQNNVRQVPPVPFHSIKRFQEAPSSAQPYYIDQCAKERAARLVELSNEVKAMDCILGADSGKGDKSEHAV